MSNHSMQRVNTYKMYAAHWRRIPPHISFSPTAATYCCYRSFILNEPSSPACSTLTIPTPDSIALGNNPFLPTHSSPQTNVLLRTLQQALVEMSAHVDMKAVSCIGVTGQMHGVVLWNFCPHPDTHLSYGTDPSREPVPMSFAIAGTKTRQKERSDEVVGGAQSEFSFFDVYGDLAVSPLFTWRDLRCNSHDFLDQMNAKLDGRSLSTGFGCATLAWFNHYSPEYLQHFSSSGTIQDLVVACLTRQFLHPKIDVTNAFSWGLVTLKNGNATWDMELCDRVGVPTHLLPEIVPSDTVVARVSESVAASVGLSSQTSVAVVVGNGDHAAAVFAQLNSNGQYIGETAILLQMGTSAQLAVEAPAASPHVAISSSTFEWRPSLKPEYRIATAAAMSGGSAFATLVDSLKGIARDIGLDVPSNDQLYRSINESGLRCLENETVTLTTIPKFAGERHSPDQRGSISGIDTSNFNLGQLSASLALGLVTNLKSMLTEDMIWDRTSVVCSGNAVASSPLVRRAVELSFPLQSIVVEEAVEHAASGAAQWSLSVTAS